MNWGTKNRWAVFTIIALLALAIRLPRLSERPMHTDEAVNAYITGQLLEGNAYHYDPRDRHGPALYALAVPLARAAGVHRFPDLTESILRLGPVIAGVIGVVLLSVTARQAGFLNAAVASLLFAIGPIAVYYQRYFIHESLFVAATMGFLLSVWFATRETAARSQASRIRWSAAAGIAAGLMLACKETAVLHFAAVAIAGAVACGPRIWRKRAAGSAISMSMLLQQAFVVGIFFCGVIFLLYTWGGRYFQGLSDLVYSIPHSMSRAAGQGHEKFFLYYFGLLVGGWSGALVLMLATVGLANSFGSRRRFAAPDSATAGSDGEEWFSFVAIYAVVIALIYSAIPYKTPWLALNLWLPISLLAGRGVVVLQPIGRTADRFISLVVIAALLGRDTWQTAFAKPSDVGNPYAYAHTSEDLLGLPDRVSQIARERNLGDQVRIAVVAADPWPLPWYLRRFPQTGFWQPDQDPGDQDCFITTGELPEQLRSRLENWRPEFFGLRPEVLIILWTRPAEDRP